MQWLKTFPGASLWYWFQCPDFDDEIIKAEDFEDAITRSEKILRVIMSIPRIL